MSVSTLASRGSWPIKCCVAACVICLQAPSTKESSASPVCLAPAQFMKAFPHTFISALDPLLPFNQRFFNFQKKRGRGDLGRSG